MTFYVDTEGIPLEWLDKRGCQLMTDKLIATFDLFDKDNKDSGISTRMRCYTRESHIPTLERLFKYIGTVQYYPFQCAPDYAEEVLEKTER